MRHFVIDPQVLRTHGRRPRNIKRTLRVVSDHTCTIVAGLGWLSAILLAVA